MKIWIKKVEQPPEAPQPQVEPIKKEEPVIVIKNGRKRIVKERKHIYKSKYNPLGLPKEELVKEDEEELDELPLPKTHSKMHILPFESLESITRSSQFRHIFTDPQFGILKIEKDWEIIEKKEKEAQDKAGVIILKEGEIKW
jgi:hypothetical protein